MVLPPPRRLGARELERHAVGNAGDHVEADGAGLAEILGIAERGAVGEVGRPGIEIGDVRETVSVHVGDGDRPGLEGDPRLETRTGSGDDSRVGGDRDRRADLEAAARAGEGGGEELPATAVLQRAREVHAAIAVEVPRAAVRRLVRGNRTAETAQPTGVVQDVTWKSGCCQTKRPSPVESATLRRKRRYPVVFPGAPCDPTTMRSSRSSPLTSATKQRASSLRLSNGGSSKNQLPPGVKSRERLAQALLARRVSTRSVAGRHGPGGP